MVLILFSTLFSQFVLASGINKLKTCKFSFWTESSIDLKRLPEICSNGEKGNVLLSLKTDQGILKYCFTFPKELKKTEIEPRLVIVHIFNQQSRGEIQCKADEMKHFSTYIVEKSMINPPFKKSLEPGVLISTNFENSMCIYGKLYQNLNYQIDQKCLCRTGYTGRKCDRLL